MPCPSAGPPAPDFLEGLLVGILPQQETNKIERPMNSRWLYRSRGARVSIPRKSSESRCLPEDDSEYLPISSGSHPAACGRLLAARCYSPCRLRDQRVDEQRKDGSKGWRPARSALHGRPLAPDFQHLHLYWLFNGEQAEPPWKYRKKAPEGPSAGLRLAGQVGSPISSINHQADHSADGSSNSVMGSNQNWPAPAAG